MEEPYKSPRESAFKPYLPKILEWRQLGFPYHIIAEKLKSEYHIERHPESIRKFLKSQHRQKPMLPTPKKTNPIPTKNQPQEEEQTSQLFDDLKEDENPFRTPKL